MRPAYKKGGIKYAARRWQKLRPAYKEGGIKLKDQKIETCLQRGGRGIHTNGKAEQGADWRCGPSPGGLNGLNARTSRKSPYHAF